MSYPNPLELTREIKALHESACSSNGSKAGHSDNRIIYHSVNAIDRAFRSGKLNKSSTQEEAHDKAMSAVPAIFFGSSLVKLSSH